MVGTVAGQELKRAGFTPTEASVWTRPVVSDKLNCEGRS